MNCTTKNLEYSYFNNYNFKNHNFYVYRLHILKICNIHYSFMDIMCNKTNCNHFKIQNTFIVL